MRSLLFVCLLLAHSLATNFLTATFELDGYPDDSPRPGLPEDWTPTLFNLGVPQDGSLARDRLALADPGDLTVFTGGGSKDNNDFNQWIWTAMSVPPKANIANTYAASYINGGNLLAFFGADLIARGSGTVTIGVWFLQDSVGAIDGGSFSGKHYDGDVLLVVDFTGNRAAETVNVQAFSWKAGATNNVQTLIAQSSTDFRCSSSTNIVCAISNPTAFSSGLPLPAADGTYGALTSTFFEGGVNFNLLFPTTTTLPCFNSYIIETRASNSISSTLQDFVGGAFSVCNIDVTGSCTNPVVEGPNPYVATFSVVVHNTGISTLTVSSIVAIGAPAGVTVTSNVPAGGASIASGAQQTFTVTYSGLPYAAVSPTVEVRFAAGGPSARRVSVDCPAPPPLSFESSRVCAKPTSGPTASYPNGWIYGITATVTAHGGSLLCTYTDSHGYPSAVSVNLTPTLATPAVTSYVVILASTTPAAASVTCTDLKGGAVATQSADFWAAPTCPQYTYAFSVAKACSNGALDEGASSLSYAITTTVSNTGEGTLFDCSISDASTGTVSSPVGSGASSINTGGSATFSYTITQTPAQQTTIGSLNDGVATGSCKNAAGQPVSSVTSSASNPAACPVTLNPAITAQKSCTATLQQGQFTSPSGSSVSLVYAKVDFTVSVTNRGNLKLQNFRIVDNRSDGTSATIGSIVFSDGSSVLAAGETKSFTANYIPASVGADKSVSDTASVDAEATLTVGLSGSNHLTAIASSVTATCSLCP